MAETFFSRSGLLTDVIIGVFITFGSAVFGTVTTSSVDADVVLASDTPLLGWLQANSDEAASNTSVPRNPLDR